MTDTSTGRASLFRDKKGGKRVQGLLTKPGGVAFERQRARIADLTGHASPSDADVIEWLARGEKDAVRAMSK
jgi:hypothetical protein